MSAATGSADELLGRIRHLLSGGGTFNPELADHAVVRDLIMDCRDWIQAAWEAEVAPDMHSIKAHRAQLWDAINEYAEACGGTPGATTLGNCKLVLAAAEIEALVYSSQHASIPRQFTP